jgi:hypothetical protein
MKLVIRCETTLAFEIEAEHDVYILELRGGEWMLSRYPDKMWNLAQGRVNWTEALKRALAKIEIHDEPVSAFELAMGRKGAPVIE